MERSVNKSLDTIDNLNFSQEYQVINTIEIVKTRLIISKHLYKEMKMINIEDNNEIFDIFEEDNRISLI